VALGGGDILHTLIIFSAN